MEIYLDLVVILNFLVDFLLLLGTNRLSGFPLSPKRCALAAAAGSVYSGICMLRGCSFLGNLLWRSVSLVGMCVLAFGWDRSAVKRGGVFVILCMALGGAAVSAGKGDFIALLLCAVGIWLLCRLAFGQKVGGQEYVPLTITYEANSVSLIGLRDSGNTLRDPMTGESVLLITGEAAQKLTGLTHAQLCSPLETLAQRPLPGLRLIPYCAIGTSGGLLLGMRFAEVKLGDRTQSAIVAFAPEGLGRGGFCQALIAAE